MKVYGLVGRSGSGKSHHAMEIAHDLGLDCIIDDGLLISGGSVAAGYSAKFESTRLAAVRRAVFRDPLHRVQVLETLQQVAPVGCLILGTSKNMVLQICHELQISPDVVHWLNVETLLTEESIHCASKNREEGMHSIPVRQTQIQQSGMLLSYIEHMIQRLHVSASGIVAGAAPIVVRPIFANGSIFISKRALRQCIECFLQDYRAHFRLRNLYVYTDTPRFQLLLHAEWQPDIASAASHVHRQMTTYLQESLGFPYPKIDIQVVSLGSPKPPKG